MLHASTDSGAVAKRRKSLSKVVEAVIREGQSQWYSFGVAMGFSDAQVKGLCFDKRTAADNLLVIIRSTTDKNSEKKTDNINELLEACKLLPLPIYGTVKDQLDKRLSPNQEDRFV